jgi:protocatechuate 3,4-dioxygenase beta subunit
MIDLSRRRLLAAMPALFLPAIPVRAWAAVEATPSATEGPFYPPRIPSDSDGDLVRVAGAAGEAKGDLLLLRGRVLDRDARPVAGAVVEIWQCDAHGVYLHPGSRRHGQADPAFQGFGRAAADGDGRFRFRTIVPVPYPGRTPHIHMKVLRDGREALTTQFYRAGFAQNASDFLYRRLSEAERARCTMTLEPVADAPRPSFGTEIRVVLA